MNYWTIAIWIYLVVAVLSYVPILWAQFFWVKLKHGGDSFDKSTNFSPENIEILKQHYSRIMGTLVFWKNEAAWYKRFHYYTLVWSLPVSILIPIIAQSISSEPGSKLFLTIISSHIAVIVGFHRALKVESNFRAFRNGESEFYDVYRRLLDRPLAFGANEKLQIENYFKEVERIRKTVRNAETDNFPLIEDAKSSSKSTQS